MVNEASSIPHVSLIASPFVIMIANELHLILHQSINPRKTVRNFNRGAFDKFNYFMFPSFVDLSFSHQSSYSVVEVHPDCTSLRNFTFSVHLKASDEVPLSSAKSFFSSLSSQIKAFLFIQMLFLTFQKTLLGLHKVKHFFSEIYGLKENTPITETNLF